MSAQHFTHRVGALLVFSLPVLAISFLQSLTGSINVAYISRLLGPSALAASSNANMVVFLIIGVLSGLPNAVMLQVGRATGAAHVEAVRKTFYETLLGFIILAVALSVVIWILTPQIITMLSVPTDSRAMAVSYLRVMCLSLFSMLVFLFVMMALRGLGETKGPFIWIAVAVLLDAAFTPLLILGFGGFPALGIEGAGWSAFLSQTVALLGMLLQMHRRHPLLKGAADSLLIKGYSFNATVEMVKEGAPLCLQIFLGSVYSLILFALVNGFGSTSTAAYVVVTQVWNYIQMPALALASGTSVLVAQQLGRGDREEVWKITRAAVLCNVLITSSLVIISVLSIEPIFAWLLPHDPEAQRIGVHLNAVAAGFIVLFSSSVVLFGVLRANKVYFVPLLTFSITQFVICLPFIYLFRPALGVDAVWISIPISYVLPLLVALIYFKTGMASKRIQY
ncbi:multidrug efflux protein [Pseudomonas sp. 37 R 15]|uniref:MATE family efflux transporter n=1 Tax=Pseudomonas sp. 37 R 15 TaxID=1844104 RepID=UPI0008126F13|nr:MATE family efflux transporter [Pseudomonas sp. 37 R 15]CRM79616.1 multidrug efflux protein [Pseudomonas sp. 37 R 15]